jgi:hypothetical protein
MGVATSDTVYNFDVRGTSNVGALTVNSNLYATGMPLAQAAANLITWNSATGDLMDSGGLISNKLAIVSEQPPGALSSNTTTVTGHGKYVLNASTLGTDSNVWNAFDKSTALVWQSASTYNSGTGAYEGSVDLVSDTVGGEYITAEFPYKTTLRHITVRPGTSTASFPASANLYGANEGSWVGPLKGWENVTPSSTSDVRTFVVDSEVAYKKYALVVNATDASAAAEIGELKFYTETFTVDAGKVSTTAASGLETGFTEHPLSALTGYRQYHEGHGTYEVRVSSEGSAQQGWKLFDENASTKWSIVSPLNQYNTSTGSWDATAIAAQPSVYTDDVGGVRHAGHWVEIKLPYPILLSQANIYPTNSLEYHAPVDGVMLGSTDGRSWHKISEFSGVTYTTDTWSSFAVNASTPYAYYRMVVTKIGTDASQNGYLEFSKLKLFAEKDITRFENLHISGDLSSETLQTGYIKWPKVPLKANESEGYVASASSVENTQSQRFEFNAFNEFTRYSGESFIPNWISRTGAFDSSGEAVNGTAASFDGNDCEWIQIKLPQSIRLSSFKIRERDIAQDGPKSGFMYGSNDGVTWSKLATFNDISYDTNSVYIQFVNSSQSYSYFRVVVTKVTVTGTPRALIEEIALYEAATGVGAAPTSAKLQVAGSLGMAKGAEFFAGDDVVMELPKHDRPLVKYPEVSASATNVTTTGLVQIWAGYTSTASSSGVTDGGRLAYDGIFDTVNPWISESGTYETTGGTATNSDSFESVSGSFLKLKLPKKIRLSHVCMYNRDSASTKAPKNGIIWGSEDGGSTFSQIHTFSNLDPTRAVKNTLHINSTGRYDVLVVQITAMQVPGSGTYDQVAIQELEYYGYEEGDESVDIVHRSVPNKPGTQHLELYWDANDSNSYSFADSSNVYDLSGNGVTGAINGTNGFDAEYNAWVFDGSAYISGTLTHTTGAWAHTVSTWVYRDVTSSTTNQHIFHFGGTSTNTACCLRFQLVNERWLLRYYFFANDVLFYPKNVGESFGNWIHIVATYDGGSDSGVSNNGFGLARKIYINGEECLVQSSSTPGSLALATTSSTFYAGNREGSALQHDLIGKMANMRVYSKALSSDQVKELFDYEAARFGHREDVVTLKNGNLGIGLRDPEQRLVVAGSLQEFPPGHMTGEYTQFTGHGIFRATATSYYDNGDGFVLPPYEAFGDPASLRWQPAGSTYNSSGTYTGSETTSVDGLDVDGEWIQLELSTRAIIKRGVWNLNMGVSGSNDYQERAPKTFTVAGSNDGSTFYGIGSFSEDKPATTDYLYFDLVNSETAYKYVRFIGTSTHGGTNGSAVCLTYLRYYGIPQMDVTDGRQLNVGQVMTSSVGIGTTAPHAPLTVYNDAYGSNHSVTTGTKAYFKYDVNFTYNQSGQHSGGLSIYALKGIMSGQYVISHTGTLQASDRRIKTNILDVNDSSALETFRLLQPKLYNYKDVVQRGSLPVWGFIAQEVGDTLSYSINKRTEWIPNVYELANVYADGTVLEFDTTKLETGASKLRLYDRNDREEDVLIDEIIDEYTVRLTNPIKSRDQVFVYGQEINDFHFLKKDAIWTTAAAALQEVDRRQQADEQRLDILEGKDHRVKRELSFTGGQGLLVGAAGLLSNVAQSKAFLGVVGEPEGIIETYGETKVWVTNALDHDIEVGDLITTSNVAGYAMQQQDDILRSSTVAKVLEPCDFTQPQVPVRRQVMETSNVNYYLKLADVTEAEYSNLAPEKRTTVTEEYYGKDVYERVFYNSYVNKMPPYDCEKYFQILTNSITKAVYDALTDEERAQYEIESYTDSGPLTYVHTYSVYLDPSAWQDLGADDQAGYTHGYFKSVVKEVAEATSGYDLRTRTLHKKILGTSTTPKDGYVLEVREEQIPTGQWYMDYENTEPAYEMRYLDEHGQQVSKYDAVYRAALLKCLLI